MASRSSGGNVNDPKPIYEDYVDQLTQLVENLQAVGNQLESDIGEMEDEVIPEARQAIKESRDESRDIQDIKERAQSIESDINRLVEAENGELDASTETKSLQDIAGNIRQLKKDVKHLKGEIIQEEELVEDDLQKFGRMASEFVDSYRQLEKFKQTEKWSQMRVTGKSMAEYARMQNRQDLQRILNSAPSERSAEEWVEHIEEIEGKLESTLENALSLFETDIQVNENEESALEGEVQFVQDIIDRLDSFKQTTGDRGRRQRAESMIEELEGVEGMLIKETREEEKILSEEETSVERLESRLTELGF